MTGYIFGDINWTNEEARQAYFKIHGPSLEAADPISRMVAQEVHVMDGDWQPNGITILITFPTVKDALAWYNSEEYRPAREILRQWASPRVLIFGD
jgi:uncharacterized protein (DUF1330 family)